MGHMLNQTEIDIIVRWHRMRGFLTLVAARAPTTPASPLR